MLNIVKNTTIPSLLDLLAPHSCRGCGCIGSVVCDCCKNYILKHHQNFCPHCKGLNQTGNCTKTTECKNLPPTYVVGERSELVGTLVHNLKFHSVRAAAKPLADLLNASLPEYAGDVYVVPLPTIAKHVRARGLDHTYLVAKNLSCLRHNFKLQKLLIRDQNTVQVGADRSTRLTQADAAYSINPKIKIDQKATYILLDDVWTTGASLRAATKKLQKSGAQKINLAILAVSRID